MKLNSFEDLFGILLSDLVLIEEQNNSIIQKMVQKCSSSELKSALEKHLKEVNAHTQKIQKIVQQANVKVEKIEWESPVKNVFTSMEKFLDDNQPSPLLDAAIITMLQQIKHLEIALYGTLREYAKVVEKNEISQLLHETLKEEKQADSLLIRLARESGINKEAAKSR